MLIIRSISANAGPNLDRTGILAYAIAAKIPEFASTYGLR